MICSREWGLLPINVAFTVVSVGPIPIESTKKRIKLF